MSHKPGLKSHLEEIIKKMVKWLEKETKNLRLHVYILNAFSIFYKSKSKFAYFIPFPHSSKLENFERPDFSQPEPAFSLSPENTTTVISAVDYNQRNNLSFFVN